MRLQRHDPLLNDAIEALDQRLAQAKRAIPKATDEDKKALAWTYLSAIEREFVHAEIARCATDRVYYMKNFHVIQPEGGILTCMTSLFDMQWMIDECLQRCLDRDGRAFIVILKSRQSGGTEYCNAVMCWRTFFLPNSFTLTIAQNPKTVSWVQRKVNVAYDYLPWWMRIERQYFSKGEYVEFNRKDESRRSTDPGLGTIMVTTHVGEAGGVAIGKSVRSLHMTECGKWPQSDIFTSDIKPSLQKSPDPIVFAESTAFGMSSLLYDLWQGAMDPTDDDADWTPLFLAAYRDQRNRRLIRPKQQPFVLTAEEQKVQDRVQVEERFTIPLEFWNFRRRGLKDSIAESGFPYGHLEAYPISPREAFQSSGYAAFARHKLDQQEANIRKPEWVGEIVFQGRHLPPKVLLNHMIDPDGHYLPVPLEKREHFNRLYLWEYPPDPNAQYYLGADAGEGVGQDYSVIELLRAGFQNAPDVQVGEWVGYEPPEAFARVIFSLATLFNRCEVAVEYNGPGRATADYLKNQLEYPNLYIPRQTDRYKNQLASFMHWQTTPKTKPLLRAKMNETLLEDGIVIQSEYLLSELRLCEAVGESFAAKEGHDDAAMAGTIALYCLRQTMPHLHPPAGDAVASASAANPSVALARALHPAIGSVVYGIYDELFRMRAQSRVQQQAEDMVARHPGWRIRPLMVSKANTAWSPIYHGRGLERELLLSGMEDRNITPDLLTVFAAATGRDGATQALGQGGEMTRPQEVAQGAASPGADEAMWNGALGDWGEMG